MHPSTTQIEEYEYELGEPATSEIPKPERPSAPPPKPIDRSWAFVAGLACSIVFVALIIYVTLSEQSK